MVLKPIVFSAAIASASFLMAGSATAQTAYQLQDLGVMGVPVFHGNSGTYGTVTAINNAGQAVGWKMGDNTSYSVATQNGALTPLTVPGSSQIAFPRNYATAINNNGQIAGDGQVLAANGLDFYGRGYIISGAQSKTIGLLNGVTEGNTYVSGINDSGMVTGYTTAVDGNQHAYIYNGSTMQDLGSALGGSGYSVGNDINNLGVVVGTYQDSANKTRSFSYDGHTVKSLNTVDQSIARAINDKGQIVGSVYTSVGEQAFIYNGSTMKTISLGGSTSSAYAINASGQVIGMSRPADNSGSRPFLYDGTSIVDISTMLTGSGTGWVLDEVNGINDLGQIVGRGYYNDEYRGFILSPVAVPEPTTLALMSLGLIGIAKVRRRTQKI
jgi:probable HAF family extracellular repeat protein